MSTKRLPLLLLALVVLGAGLNTGASTPIAAIKRSMSMAGRRVFAVFMTSSRSTTPATATPATLRTSRARAASEMLRAIQPDRVEWLVSLLRRPDAMERSFAIRSAGRTRPTARAPDWTHPGRRAKRSA